MNFNHKKAVFFDFGDTLASTKPSYFERVAFAFRQSGYLISKRDFENAYLKSDYEIYKRYKNLGTISNEEYHQWLLPNLCKNLSINSDIKILRTKIIEALDEIKYTRSAVQGALELLDFLKQHEFLLGIISNNDGHTELKCEQVGIKDYFEAIIDSTVLGISKPDSRIFSFALNKLDLSAIDVVHIGDFYGSDVLAAKNSGIDAIWFNKRNIEKFDESKILEVKDMNEIKSFFDINKQKTT